MPPSPPPTQRSDRAHRHYQLGGVADVADREGRLDSGGIGGIHRCQVGGGAGGKGRQLGKHTHANHAPVHFRGQWVLANGRVDGGRGCAAHGLCTRVGAGAYSASKRTSSSGLCLRASRPAAPLPAPRPTHCRQRRRWRPGSRGPSRSRHLQRSHEAITYATNSVFSRESTITRHAAKEGWKQQPTCRAYRTLPSCRTWVEFRGSNVGRVRHNIHGEPTRYVGWRDWPGATPAAPHQQGPLLLGCPLLLRFP